MSKLFEQEPESLEQAVVMAIGRASSCWENLAGAGVFQDQDAADTAKELLAYIKQRYTRVPENACEIIICPACGLYDAIPYWDPDGDPLQNNLWGCRNCSAVSEAKEHR